MPPPDRPPTLWQRLVGLFVAWQLLFLLAANAFFLLQRVAHREPGEPATPLTAAAETLPKLTWPYAQLTGQWQGWSLFAPNVPRHAALVFTELRWADGERVRIESTEQPDDLKHYWRPLGT